MPDFDTITRIFPIINFDCSQHVFFSYLFYTIYHDLT